MKIMIINPDSGMTQEDFNLRCSILKNYCGEDVKLHMECITESEISLDSMYEAALAAPEIIRRAIRAEKEGYDAIVLYCFSDPALEACQEILHIPVVGAGMAACHMASFVSRQCGLIISSSARRPEKIEYCIRRGFMPTPVSSVGLVSMEGASVWDSREKVIEHFSDAAFNMMEQDGIQAVIIGCLSYLGVASEIAQRIHIPVIDAAVAAVSMAESMVRQRLFMSKKAYPDPLSR